MDKYTINNLNVFRSVFDYIDSNMYILLEGRSALVIDPHVNLEAVDLLTNAKIEKVDILLTHEHTDHTSGIPFFQEKFGAKLVCQQDCAEYIADSQSNRPLLISFILTERDRVNGTNFLEKFNAEYKPFTCKADVVYKDKMIIQWENHKIELISTPGHSVGSNCIILDDAIVFTGDSLIPDLPTITRFPGGSTKNYKNITLPFLKSLDKNLTVLPGHGNICKMADFSERFKEE